jgi:hypothetical protein
MSELMKRGVRPSSRAISELTITGVGKGASSASQAVSFPGAAIGSEGTVQPLVFDTPVVQNSGIPPLWGLRSLREQRAVVDCHGLKLHLLGQGDLRLNLPPGSRTFQLELSEGGHLILPISEFDALQSQTPSSGTSKKTLTFAAQVDEISPRGTTTAKTMTDQGTQPDDDMDVEWRRKHLGFQPRSR